MNNECQFQGPLFIIGMPRSGTKLVRGLLNNHSSIGIPNVETEFLPWLDKHLEDFGDLRHRQNFERFYQRAIKIPYFIFKEEQGRRPSAEQWFNACRNFDVSGVFEAAIRLDIDAKPGSKVIWGDKSPSYVRHVPLLANIFPEARFVHIIRDARDYCLSINRAWGKDIFRAAQRWADCITEARSAAESVDNLFIEIHYEELLSQPIVVLKRVCHFLELQFDPHMLDLIKPPENIGNAKGEKRIISSNAGKFREKMDKKTLARVEQIAGEVLVNSGYILEMPMSTTRRLGQLEVKMAQLRDAWNLVKRAKGIRGLWKAVFFHVSYFFTTRRL